MSYDPERPELASMPGPNIMADKLRAELVEYRTAAGLARETVAAAIGMSASGLLRAELGHVKLTQSHVSRLLEYYEKDAQTIEDAVGKVATICSLSQETRKSNTLGLPPEILEYTEYENYAGYVDIYSRQTLPDMLHTDTYSQALGISFYNHSAQPTWYSQFKADRAAYLLGPHGPTICIVVNEEVFYRWDTRSLAKNQPNPAVQDIITRLNEVNTVGRESYDSSAEPYRNPNVSVRVLPFKAGAIYPLMRYGDLIHLEFDDPDVPARTYGVNPMTDTFGRQTDIDFNSAFEQVLTAIPGPEDTSAVLEEVYGHYVDRMNWPL